jgi:hypothetical protein
VLTPINHIIIHGNKTPLLNIPQKSASFHSVGKSIAEKAGKGNYAAIVFAG